LTTSPVERRRYSPGGAFSMQQTSGGSGHLAAVGVTRDDDAVLVADPEDRPDELLLALKLPQVPCG
jgi:hypothetical protein